MIFQIIFLFITISNGKNYCPNGDFEQNTMFATDNLRGCKRTNETSHSGSYSIYCKDDDPNQQISYYQISYNFIPGLRYNLSAWIKMKGVTNGGNVVLHTQATGNYQTGVWDVSSSQHKECQDGTCDDKWYFISKTSTHNFHQKSYSISYNLQPQQATGEFWIDDLSVEPVIENYLYSVDVISWRQEVFEDPVEVRIATKFLTSIFEKGEYCQFKMDIYDIETNSFVMTNREFHMRNEYEQIVVSMQLNPKSLKPGYYFCRIAFYNTVTENLEIVSTKFRKLSEKRSYNIFVDVDNRCFVNNKLFFPLGMYIGNLIEDDYVKFKDSPYNLVISYVSLDKNRLDKFYTDMNQQIRVINDFRGAISWNRTKFDENVQTARTLAKSWKESPGLFGYYIADEPDVWLTEIMSKSTWATREEDKDHPVFSTVHQRYNMGKLKEGLDVVGFDDYPLQNYDKLNAIFAVGRQGRDRMGNSRAMWNIPQIFDWTVFGRQNESPPTEKQLTNMISQWIALGGMGIIYFSHNNIRELNHKNPFDVEWEKVKKVSVELMNDYVPIILSNVKPNPGYSFPACDDLDLTTCIAFRLFRYKGNDYILAVSTSSDKTITKKFTKPINVKLNIKKHLTGKSQMAQNGAEVTLTMMPFEVLWLYGNGDGYTADESNYDKPNLKSKFDSSLAKTNENLGKFPDLPLTMNDPTLTPKPVDNSTSDNNNNGNNGNNNNGGNNNSNNTNGTNNNNDKKPNGSSYLNMMIISLLLILFI